MSDSIGELKVKVAFDVDVDGSKKQHEQAARQATSEWQSATRTIQERQQAATAAATSDASEKWSGVADGIRNAVLAATAVVGALGVGLVHSAVQIDRQARSLGMNVQEFQRLQYAAEAAGVETNDMLAAVGQLSQKAADAEAGGGAAQLFDELGISATNADGSLKSANDLMLESADALARLPEGSRRTAAALQLFGDAGRKLVPVLGEGREGMEGLFNEFDALGGGVSEDAARKSREMEHALTQLKLAFISAAQPIIEQVLPALTGIAEKLQPLLGNTHALKVGLAALGLALLGVAAYAMIMNASMLPMYALAALIAAAIAAVVLIVDDLIVTFEGGDSATRRLIDGMLGFGATTAIVESVKGAFESLTTAVGAAADAVLGPFFAAISAIESAWDMVPEPVKRLLMGTLGIAVPIAPGPLGALAPALGTAASAGGSGAFSEGAAIDAQNILGNALAIARTAAPATVTATPGQTARAAATNATARGGARTVNRNARAEVRINGLVDPGQLQGVIGPIVQTAIEQMNADSLEDTTDTDEEP